MADNDKEKSPFRIVYIGETANLASRVSAVVSSSATTPFTTTFIRPSQQWSDHGGISVSGNGSNADIHNGRSPSYFRVRKSAEPDNEKESKSGATAPTMVPLTSGEKFSFPEKKPQTPERQPPEPAESETDQIVLDPFFKVTLNSVGLITLATFGAGIFLSLIDQPTANIDKAIDVCWDVFKIGAGAIIGLLGGKSL